MLFLRGTFSELVLEAQLECSLASPPASNCLLAPTKLLMSKNSLLDAVH